MTQTSWQTMVKNHINMSDLFLSLNIKSIDEYVTIRTLRWFGHVSRMPTTRLPRQLLQSWIPQPRPVGRPKMRISDTLSKTLKKRHLINNKCESLSFNDLTPFTSNRHNWRIITRHNDWQVRTDLQPFWKVFPHSTNSLILWILIPIYHLFTITF